MNAAADAPVPGCLSCARDAQLYHACSVVRTAGRTCEQSGVFYYTRAESRVDVLHRFPHLGLKRMDVLFKYVTALHWWRGVEKRVLEREHAL